MKSLFDNRKEWGVSLALAFAAFFLLLFLPSSAYADEGVNYAWEEQTGTLTIEVKEDCPYEVGGADAFKEAVYNFLQLQGKTEVDVQTVIITGDGEFPLYTSMFRGNEYNPGVSIPGIIEVPETRESRFQNLVTFDASNGNVTKVEGYAFGDCAKLENVLLNDKCIEFSQTALALSTTPVAVLDLSVTKITQFGSDGSGGVRSPYLKEIYFPDTLVQLGGDDLTNDIGSPLAQCKVLEKVIFAEGTKLQVVDTQAFYYCQALEEVALPYVVGEIGKDAFTYCTSLQRITMPYDLDLPESTQTFTNCTALQSITLTCSPSSNAGANESVMREIDNSLPSASREGLQIINELHEVDSDLKCTKCEGQLDLVADPLVADDSVYAAFEQSAGNNHINGAYKMSLTDEEGNTIEEVDVAEGSSLSISLGVEGVDNGTNVRLLQYSSDGTVSSVSDEPFQVADGQVSFETNSLASAYAVVLMGSAEDGSLTVTFDANGGQFADGDETTEVSVLYDGMVAKPAVDPTRENYNFTGWYTDKDCTEEYDFESLVEGDMTLYAGWEEVEADDPTDPANPDDSEDSTDPTDSTGDQDTTTDDQDTTTDDQDATTNDQDATTNDQSTTTDNESASTSSSGTSQTTALSKAGDDSTLGFGLAGFFAALASLGGVFAYRKCRAR